MKKLLLIPLLFLLSGCYTVLSPSVGIRSNVRPGVEVYYDWYTSYPTVYFAPYFYYPRWNRVVYTNYYEFNNHYYSYHKRHPVQDTYVNKTYTSRSSNQGKSRNTITRSNTATRSTPRSVENTRSTEKTTTRSSTRSTPRTSTARSSQPRSTTRSAERSSSRTTERRTPRKKDS